MLAPSNPLLEDVHPLFAPENLVTTATDVVGSISCHQVEDLVIDLDGRRSPTTLTNNVVLEAGVKIVSAELDDGLVITLWSQKSKPWV